MPFDPLKPAANSPLDSAEMRAQLNGLNDRIDAVPAGPEGPMGPPGEVTMDQMTSAIQNAVFITTSNSSANSNAVAVLDLAISDPPTQAEVQAVVSKLNELILALRR